MKRIAPIFLLYLSACFGLEEEFLTAETKKVSPPPPPPYDADLYQRDLEVWFTNVEFLYWRVEEDALDYAYQMQKPAWGPTPSFAQGHEKRAKFHYKPGFRAAIGYFNAPKYWEVWLQYTWLYDHGKNTVNKPKADNLFLIPTYPQLFTSPIQKATSEIGLHYHVIDMLVDRVFNPNEHLRLRLFGGIPLTYQEQNWQVKYFDGLANSTKIQQHWRFRGVGLKAGLSLDWYWGANVYIASAFSSGLLLGDYKNLSYEKTTFAPADSDNPDVPIRNALRKDLRLAYTVQFLFGPCYEKAFCKSRLEIFAGYELNAWFNLQEVYRSSALTLPGNPLPPTAAETWQSTGVLGLHGVTARVTYNF